MRRGRFTHAQRRAVETLFPLFGIPYAPAIINFERTFDRSAPTVLEIGCGMGETTAAIAQSRPDVNFVAVEVFSAGVGALLKLLDEQRLSNVRIVHHDDVEVLRDMIAPETLAGIHIFFPDPWPKKRHQKRRLVSQPFVRLLASRLAPHGYLHCATDWQDYAESMQQVLADEPLLANLRAGYAPAPDNPLCVRPVTKFHARGDRLGHTTSDMVFVRRVVA